LGALDLKLRRQMQIELKWIQTEVGITFVHVTHDQEEAMTMADTVAVMNNGKIEQLGSPADLYENPKTVFVANFLGQSNFIDGVVESTDGSTVIANIHGTRITFPKSRNNASGSALRIGIRPEKFRLHDPGDNTHGNVLTGGKITDISFTGVSTQYLVEMPWKQELVVFEQNDGGAPDLVKGDPVTLSWEPQFTFALDGSSK
jgi:spermidine/putrescine transport system ATP-binding protein